MVGKVSSKNPCFGRSLIFNIQKLVILIDLPIRSSLLPSLNLTNIWRNYHSSRATHLALFFLPDSDDGKLRPEAVRSVSLAASLRVSGSREYNAELSLEWRKVLGTLLRSSANAASVLLDIPYI
jgi:hypothetical protein